METFTKLDDRQDLLDSITILEKELSAKTGKDVALVAYSPVKYATLSDDSALKFFPAPMSSISVLENNDFTNGVTTATGTVAKINNTNLASSCASFFIAHTRLPSFEYFFYWSFFSFFIFDKNSSFATF